MTPTCPLCGQMAWDCCQCPCLGPEDEDEDECEDECEDEEYEDEEYEFLEEDTLE